MTNLQQVQSALGTDVITQIGMLVHDVERSAQAWAALLSQPVSPISGSGPYEQTQAQYRGQPCQGRVRQAFYQCGGVQLELIEPDAQPSIWRECLNQDGEGLHHVAFQIQDMAGKIACLEGMGMPLLQKGEYPGGRYAYLDGRDSVGLIVELLEND